jgi:hypothetical protein
MSSATGFATPNNVDHRAWLWVTGFLALIYSLLCLAARITGKWGLLWWDDLVLGGSYLTAFIHWGLLFSAIHNGLGVSEFTLSQSAMETAGRVSEIHSTLQRRHCALRIANDVLRSNCKARALTLG